MNIFIAFVAISVICCVFAQTGYAPYESTYGDNRGTLRRGTGRLSRLGRGEDYRRRGSRYIDGDNYIPRRQRARYVDAGDNYIPRSQRAQYIDAGDSYIPSRQREQYIDTGDSYTRGRQTGRNRDRSYIPRRQTARYVGTGSSYIPTSTY
ncbi:uncharacterized protein LOC123523543 [Mercenaria mercenaria]|uniref:uncharacterized protein LOC123523543 n=1 Tax=Mercenaria mercenaria TaxID=6596 RepID=UPI00234F3E6B|nr:uncharacterized protein LOC123523543 [Mercenaria mercenaria]